VWDEFQGNVEYTFTRSDGIQLGMQGTSWPLGGILVLWTSRLRQRILLGYRIVYLCVYQRLIFDWRGNELKDPQGSRAVRPSLHSRHVASSSSVGM